MKIASLVFCLLGSLILPGIGTLGCALEGLVGRKALSARFLVVAIMGGSTVMFVAIVGF